ncbi:MAG: CYTH domain-containing protein, partial [Sphingomonas sp.]
MSAETETELKLVADEAAIAAIVGNSSLFGGRTETRQVSTYFDTTDLALSAAGLSLRVRAIGDRRIQTVKADRATMASLFARAEWERDIDGDAPEPADLTEALGKAPPDRLVPMFRTEVERVKTIFVLDDSKIEMVADRGCVVAGEAAGGATAPIGEIELELMAGDAVALFGLARRIARV